MKSLLPAEAGILDKGSCSGAIHLSCCTSSEWRLEAPQGSRPESRERIRNATRSPPSAKQAVFGSNRFRRFTSAGLAQGRRILSRSQFPLARCGAASHPRMGIPAQPGRS